MKKNILFGALMAMSVYSAQAQFTIQRDVNGIPVGTIVGSDISGTPFLYKDYVKGHVMQEDNTYFDNMTVNYDVYKDRVTFISQGGIEMAFQKPVKEFMLVKPGSVDVQVFRNGYPENGDNTSTSYYQVVADGKTQVLKRMRKAVVESTPYGGKLQKTLVNSEQYYMYVEGRFTKIRRDKKSFLVALSDKKDQVSKFITENGIDFKSDVDVVRVLEYYNSLTA